MWVDINETINEELQDMATFFYKCMNTTCGFIEFLTFAPWVSIAPGLFLFTTMIAFNLLGDGVRDYLDPKDKVAT